MDPVTVEDAGAESAGTCPRCGRPAHWVPIDDTRRGKACRACAWVELPKVVVVRHNVNTVLRTFFPDSRLAAAVDFALLALKDRLGIGKRSE